MVHVAFYALIGEMLLEVIDTPFRDTLGILVIVIFNITEILCTVQFYFVPLYNFFKRTNCRSFFVRQN